MESVPERETGAPDDIMVPSISPDYLLLRLFSVKKNSHVLATISQLTVTQG